MKNEKNYTREQNSNLAGQHSNKNPNTSLLTYKLSYSIKLYCILKLLSEEFLVNDYGCQYWYIQEIKHQLKGSILLGQIKLTYKATKNCKELVKKNNC